MKCLLIVIFLGFVLGGCVNEPFELDACGTVIRTASYLSSIAVDTAKTSEKIHKVICRSLEIRRPPLQAEIRSDDEFDLSQSSGSTGDVIRINKDANLTARERMEKAIRKLKEIKHPGYDTLHNPLYFRWDTTIFKDDTQTLPRIKPGRVLPFCYQQ
ncbi:hypothetical protein GF359_09300 [candidate division WOR-3 bacterium]|uniref:Lipoprotein n=1 Tax=candidate division WOR-3 bacterium TaxID=2052148 RepID=A0A9D5KC84_UNCW3|nr:hypothetical protein [candidate division WOR-3 bacterium]MBD3365395.1 hypothetical protein [candidate division WOR-3 bacterium]